LVPPQTQAGAKGPPLLQPGPEYEVEGTKEQGIPAQTKGGGSFKKPKKSQGPRTREGETGHKNSKKIRLKKLGNAQRTFTLWEPSREGMKEVI